VTKLIEKLRAEVEHWKGIAHRRAAENGTLHRRVSELEAMLAGARARLNTSPEQPAEHG